MVQSSLNRILIIGGCGFIGANLISYLNKQDINNIIVFDNESVGSSKILNNLNIEMFYHGDIRDFKSINDLIIEGDQIVLLAGQTNVVKSIENLSEDLEINILGSLNVLKAARDNGAQRLVFASSSAPIGSQLPPMHENLAPLPTSPYGASKLAVEGYCSVFFQAYGLPTIALRFSNCYGPGSIKKTSVVAHFLREILDGNSLIIYGDGNQTRDFIYVQDVCRAILCAISSDAKHINFGQPIQIASGSETSINTLIQLIKNTVGPDFSNSIKVDHAPIRLGEIIRNYALTEKAKAQIDFSSRVSLEEGLIDTWKFFREEWSDRS